MHTTDILFYILSSGKQSDTAHIIVLLVKIQIPIEITSRMAFLPNLIVHKQMPKLI